MKVSYGISLILFSSRINSFKSMSRLTRLTSTRRIVFPKDFQSKIYFSIDKIFLKIEEYSLHSYSIQDIIHARTTSKRKNLIDREFL